MLEVVAPLLGDGWSRDIRGRLDKDGAVANAANWELALAYGFSRVGTVEPVTGRDRNPEFVFSPERSSLKLVIEVTAVSDDGLEKRNPVRHFTGELTRLAIRYRLHQYGGWRYEIGSATSGPLLAVPSRSEMQGFFKSARWLEFLGEVRRDPTRTRVFRFSKNGGETTIAFVPGPGHSTGYYPNYRGLESLDDNHIVDRLKDKNNQIKRSGLSYPAVVFLCDNDCDALLRSPHIDRPSARKSVERFLNGQQGFRTGPWVVRRERPPRTSRISGVFLLGVRQHDSWGERRTLRQISCDYVPNRQLKALDEELLKAVAAAIENLPAPQDLPANARRRFPFPRHFGGGTISVGGRRTTMRMSLKSVQGLLLGTISFDEFAAEHAMHLRAMRYAVEHGRQISRMAVVTCPDDDDDWVEIELCEEDPERAFSSDKVVPDGCSETAKR